MGLRAFVTGGSGFVGQAVIDALLTEGHEVVALVNRTPLPQRAGVRSVPGGLFDPAALAGGLEGCDAVIHLVGIIMEDPRRGITFDRIHHLGSRNVIDAAVAAGVRRYVQMSALGVRGNAVSDYHRTKHLAETYLKLSGLEATILRPSLIHGPAGEFMRMEAAWARRKSPPYLFMPYFGRGLLGLGGAGRLQPVYVNDVARAFVQCLSMPETIGKIYELGGPDVLTWPELHRTVATAVVGTTRAVIAIPAWYARAITHITPAAFLPFNRDQVAMSQEDNTCDPREFVDAFGWTPRRFEPTLRAYAKEL